MQDIEIKMTTPDGKEVKICRNCDFKIPDEFHGVALTKENISGSFTFEWPYHKTAQRLMYEHQLRTGRPQKVRISEPMPWE